MKKIAIIIAAIAVFGFSANAQSTLTEGIDIASGNKVESKLRIVFPMHFGFSTLVNPTYNGNWAGTSYGNFLDTQFFRNFNYGIEPLGIRFFSKSSPFEFGLGIRFSFLDFTMANPNISFHKQGDAIVPYDITTEQSAYDGAKSKVHGSYVGVPLRIFFKAGKAKLYAGVSGEYMFHGYTKYRSPNAKVTLNDMFNRVRGSVEVGATYGIIGFFASYTFTPVFKTTMSDATAVSFGLTLGM